MADFDSLGQFRERKAARTPAAKRPAAQTGNKVPAGYDPDIWQLAQEFQSVAGDYGVGLAAGLPVIYNTLSQRIKISGFRAAPGWITTVQRMIKVFWEDEVDVEHESQGHVQFCGGSWGNCEVAVKRQDDAEKWRKAWLLAPREQPPIAQRRGAARREPEPDLPDQASEPVTHIPWDELWERAKTISQKGSRP